MELMRSKGYLRLFLQKHQTGYLNAHRKYCGAGDAPIQAGTSGRPSGKVIDGATSNELLENAHENSAKYAPIPLIVTSDEEIDWFYVKSQDFYFTLLSGTWGRNR